MAAKKPGCVSSPLPCSFTTDINTKPVVICGAVATYVFTSSANGSTFFVCTAHLATEQARVPDVITNVTAVPRMLPETAVSG